VHRWGGRSRILSRLRGGISISVEHILRYVGFWNPGDGLLRVQIKSALLFVVESITMLM
jgi:hypothetical protein